MSHMLSWFSIRTYICSYIPYIKVHLQNVCGECMHLCAPIITDVILALAVDRDRIMEWYSRPTSIPSFCLLE